MLWVQTQLCPSWQQHRLPACSSAAALRDGQTSWSHVAATPAPPVGGSLKSHRSQDKPRPEAAKLPSGV